MSARKQTTSTEQDSSKPTRRFQTNWGDPKNIAIMTQEMEDRYEKVVNFIYSNSKIISDKRVYTNTAGIPFKLPCHYMNDDK